MSTHYTGVSFTTVTAYTSPSSGTLPTIYTDSGLTTPTPNPFASFGNYSFYAAASNLYVIQGDFTRLIGSGAGGINQLTGDVTAGPGTGSQVATIAANAVTTTKINNAAVTLAKIANAAASSKLVGSGASGSGAAYSELTLGSGLSMSGTTLSVSSTGATNANAANVITDETRAIASYGDCATVGPAVTLTTDTSAIVWVSCYMYRTGTGGSGRMSFAVSGATTIAAGDNSAAIQTSALSASIFTASGVFLVTGLTAGSNTFTAKYYAESAVTWHFVNRGIAVLAL